MNYQKFMELVVTNSWTLNNLGSKLTFELLVATIKTLILMEEKREEIVTRQHTLIGH